jgi:hypothetical protein
MKKALIVTAFARFVKSFLTNDILILQSMGYEVHCAANIHHAGAECMDEYFKEMNVVFHQIDFSSSKPISKETYISYREMKKYLMKYNLMLCIAILLLRVQLQEWQVKNKENKAVKCYTQHMDSIFINIQARKLG